LRLKQFNWLGSLAQRKRLDLGKNTQRYGRAVAEGRLAEKIKAFAEEGEWSSSPARTHIDAQRFSGLGWGEVQQRSGRNYRILRWVEDEGPLAKTDEG
jgi:hypothetical protein